MTATVNFVCAHHLALTKIVDTTQAHSHAHPHRQRRRHLQPRHRGAGARSRAAVRRGARRRARRRAVLAGPRDHRDPAALLPAHAARRASRPTASTARPPTASRSARTTGRTSTSCSPASTSAATSATRCGTPARSPPRSRRRCSACAASRSARRSTTDEPDFERAQAVGRAGARDCCCPTTDLTLVNVNFPRRAARHPLDAAVGAPLRRQGRARQGPDGPRASSGSPSCPLERAEEGTDRWAVEHGYVSMTPLRLDLTDEKLLTTLEENPTHVDVNISTITREITPDRTRQPPTTAGRLRHATHNLHPARPQPPEEGGGARLRGHPGSKGKRKG